MKYFHPLAALLTSAAVALVAPLAVAMYHPATGRFLQRDPGGSAGQYTDGMTLYHYVSCAPTTRADPAGLWGRDFHHGLTLEAATKAGMACADEVASGCNRPDEDERDAPSSFTKALELDAQAKVASLLHKEAEAQRLRQEAQRLRQQAADWHFPVSADGQVHPDSTAANAKVDKGIKDCDFKLFSEGLHTLQDSWSHQGVPYTNGLGHARGAVQVPRVEVHGIGVGGQWVRLTGAAAALSGSADDVAIWPEDARAAALATYQKMLSFKKDCPCACPGPQGTKAPTSSKEAAPANDVETWLNQKFPGKNKV